MTLTLFLLRHAKSGHDDPKLADIDRPLNERGRREAAEMAHLIAARSYRPARILCSSAQRTRETLAPLLPTFDGNTRIEIARRVYSAAAEDLLDLIHEQSDEVPSLMLIGHNPACEQLARMLAGSGDHMALMRLRMMFPPASLVVLDFEMPDWRGVEAGTGRIEAFETPGD